MRHSTFIRWARRHLGVLLCLALLLPTAQVAGAAHMLSHLAGGGAAGTDSLQVDDRGQDLAHQAACAICPLAAAVGLGGAAAAAAALPAGEPPAFFVVSATAPRIAAAGPRLFDSRGPPPFLH